MTHNNRILKGVLEWLLENNEPGNVIIDNNSLLESLTEDDKTQKSSGSAFKSLRFELLISIIISIFVLIIIYAFTLINDYILFETEMHVNEQGALNPQKALNCEYAMYLFNTSEPWANTGIRINKGDKYKIAISGATNTSITDMLEAARNNTVPEYNWYYYDNPKTEEDINKIKKNLELCITKGAFLDTHNKGIKDTVLFGSLLYTIQSEAANVIYEPQNVDRKDIFKWEVKKEDSNTFAPNCFRTANNSGYLYLAVNDIVFGKHEINDSSSVVDSQIKMYDELMVKDNEGYPFPLNKSGKRVLSQNGSYFYYDNLGQILVSVEIQRRIPFSFFSPPLNALRDYETGLSETWQDKSQCVPLKLAKSIWKTFYLIFVDAIYIILYSVICFVAVFILDRLLRALYFIFRWIKIICTSLFSEIFC